MDVAIAQTTTRFQKITRTGEPFRFHSGATIPEATLAYETYGELAPDRSNAILLFHALSGSQHAAGHNPKVEGVGDLWTEECHEGWWSRFIGPGLALDTSRFFVICANYIGGCYGSTGPASIDPTTDQPYGSRFPNVRIIDVARSQAALLNALGIHQLHACIGASLGGLLATTFACAFPDRVRIVIPVASGLQTSALQRITSLEQICAIENDPNFGAGDYYDGPRPDHGLALARMISHKTFISLRTMERRARREIAPPPPFLEWYQVSDPLESYMLYQGTKFVTRFDANTYLRILEAWQRYNLPEEVGAADHNDAFRLCAAAGQRFLIFSIDSDVCFYPEQQATLTATLKAAGVPTMHITAHSDKGHDSFLLEPELYTPHLAYTLSHDLTW